MVRTNKGILKISEKERELIYLDRKMLRLIKKMRVLRGEINIF